MPDGSHTSRQNEPILPVIEALQTLIQTVHKSLDLETILNDALDKIMELFHCKSTHVRLIDRFSNELVVAAYRGYTADELAKLAKRRKIGESFASIPIESSEVIIIEDIDTDHRYGNRQGFARTIQCRSLIYLPLHGKEAILGDLVIHYTEPHAFTPEEVNLSSAIGHLIGTAIENALLHKEKIEEIDERRRAEEELLASRDKISLILNSISEGIYGIDGEGNCTFCNNACLRSLGYGDEKDLLGKNIHELIHHTKANGSFYPKDQCILQKVLADTAPIHKEKVTLFRADGTGLPVEYWAHPILKDDKCLGAVASFIDITEREKLEAQLQQAQKMEAIGNLAGGIAHDFNNLLTGILGHANLLTLSNQPGTPVYVAAATIERAAERASELTRQLLGFARKGKYQIQPVNIHELILDVIRLLGRTLDKRITLTQRFMAGFPHVRGDPGQLQQVLMNLAINARNVMENGGELSFRTEIPEMEEENGKKPYGTKPGRYLLISVADTGQGIAKEHIGRIFEPFYTTKELGKGTGMGLAMVYGIVKNHEGYIDVESEIGRGTTFKVYLPLEEGASASDGAESREKTISGAERILVIDDEEIVRNLATAILEKFGYQVATAVDGEEGVRIYREAGGNFDLVVIDMVMPKLGGRDCFIELKKINPHIKAILSTGYSLNGEAQEILGKGVIGFIQKPYRVAQFGQAVKQAIST